MSVFVYSDLVVCQAETVVDGPRIHGGYLEGDYRHGEPRPFTSTVSVVGSTLVVVGSTLSVVGSTWASLDPQ